MQKGIFLVLAIAITVLLTIPAFSEEITKETGVEWRHTHTYTDADTDTQNDAKSGDETELGAKLDVPNLIRFTENWTAGVEGGKDLLHTNSSQGWFAYAKITYSGSLLDFSKKK